MLILARTLDQKIRIGDDITITVVRGHNIRLGIEAPRDMPIHREEIYQIIKQRERKNA